jgi:alanine racemase
MRVHLDVLRDNMHRIQDRHPDQHVAPILKSNAYGHGLVGVARILDTEAVPFIVVDSYYEARLLRDEGIRSPLLIIGYTYDQTIYTSKLRHTAFTVTTIDQLEELAAARRSRQHTIHLKFDTGMHRQGLQPDECARARELLAQAPHLTLAGVCTHLADADNGYDSVPTMRQIERWNAIAQFWRNTYPQVPYFHVRATKGPAYTAHIDANVMRIGMGLYGARAPSADYYGLKPCMEMRTIVTGVRQIDRGEGVGYNFHYVTDVPHTIATIPVGYHEGLDARLSNTGYVLVHGQPAPIIGKISMNIATIDVSDIAGVSRGDPVVVISSRRSDPNSVESIGARCGTGPYQIVSRIPAHIRRQYVSGS